MTSLSDHPSALGDTTGTRTTLVYRGARVMRRAAARIVSDARAPFRVTRNWMMLLAGRPDYGRWSSAEGLEPWWDQRTIQLARLVPAGTRVMEFGAGRRTLEACLPAGCTYTPSDLVDRGPGTIVCDLNCRPLPDLRPHAFDVAVFGGVLEYVSDVQRLAKWLADSGIGQVVASYDAVPANGHWLARWRERGRRGYFGYMSSLSAAQLVAAFAAHGFGCVERQMWTTQGIYRFVRLA
jgi:hypothetical protein